MKALSDLSLFTVSEVQLSYRPTIRPSERPSITFPDQSYAIFIRNWNHNLIELSEQFYLMLLNTGNKVIGIIELSNGSITSTVVDIKMVFAIALKSMAVNILVAHNHPSGNIEHSDADIAITKKLVEAGKLLDIRVADHLIVSPERYFSFADQRDIMTSLTLPLTFSFISRHFQYK